MEVVLLFFIAGAIILVGFLGNVAFEKFKIPDVLVLLGIGVVLGPVFNLIDHRLLSSFAESFGMFALIVILFEGGMDVKIRTLIQTFRSATLLVLVSFFLTAGAITACLYQFVAWPLLPSLLLGTILGCTSAAIVVPVVAKMSLKEEVKTILTIESAMSDVLAVVLAVSLIEFARFESIGIERPLRAIASSFSIAIVLGTVAGLFWNKVLLVLGDRKYSYMVTLGVVLVVTATVDFLGGSGPIAILLFGIVLGNCGEIPFLSGPAACGVIEETIKFFHGEVTFFIRTFFFVYIGMLMTPAVLSPRYLGISVALFVIIAAMRYLSVEFVERRSGRDPADRRALFFMHPRGLASAVLASLPVSAGVQGSEDFIVYTVSVIVLSNILMTAGVFRMEKKAVEGAVPNG
ncbi:MAG: cation:proton antiporter [Syntrophales bacterium]